MEILVFVLVFTTNLNLVLTEDKVAIENTVASKDSSDALTDQETNDFNDQLAESSQSIAKAFGNIVVTENLKETYHEPQHRVQAPEEATGIERSIQVTDSSRNNAAVSNSIHVPQQNFHQGYVLPPQGQQLYLQYPTHEVKIFGAEASPLQQTRDSENPQALGYTSYIEHLSEKDEEELKSALKDGSVSDIKRLVPKSGISFKIYQTDKNRQTHQTHYAGKTPQEVSVYHHKIRGEAPAPPIGQAEVYQEDPQPSLFVKDNTEEHRDPGYAQQLLQSHVPDQQGLNAQAVYTHYTPPETQKTPPEANGKTSSIAKQHFKINVAESNYNKQATVADFRGNLKSPSRSSKQSQKQWNFNGQINGVVKARPGKTLEALQYELDPFGNENNKRLPQTQGSRSALQNFNSHKAENSFVEAAKHDSASYLSDSYVTKTSQNNFVGHLANFAHSDQKVSVNLLPENQIHPEGIKPGHVVNHLPTVAYTTSRNHFAVADSEAAKSGQHSLLSPLQKSSYVDVKSSHNFDHQKALEGSTPFDIKNAIDGSGSLIHQTDHSSPTTADIHPLDQPKEKPLTYIISKIPSVIIDNNIPNSVVEGHQIKDFEHAGLRTPAQFSYHPTAEVPAKLYHHPQTFLWTSEHFKQGNALTSKDLHQPLLRLHLPKEELFIKTPNVEFPVVPQQKEPLTFHYDYPFVKTFPQELHYQANTKTRVQPNLVVGHLKPGQPLPIDWSLYKSSLSNYGINPLGIKPELISQIQESGKAKIVPILVRKRKNRSNNKREVGIVYGKVNANRRPKKPSHRQEKNVRGNVLTETRQLETRDERKNEFSVSASYKVDRSSKSS